MVFHKTTHTPTGDERVNSSTIFYRFTETTHTPAGDESRQIGRLFYVIRKQLTPLRGTKESHKPPVANVNTKTTHTPTGDESVIRAEYMGALAKETTPTPTGTIKKQ